MGRTQFFARQFIASKPTEMELPAITKTDKIESIDAYDTYIHGLNMLIKNWYCVVTFWYGPVNQEQEYIVKRISRCKENRAFYVVVYDDHTGTERRVFKPIICSFTLTCSGGLK